MESTSGRWAVRSRGEFRLSRRSSKPMNRILEKPNSSPSAYSRSHTRNLEEAITFIVDSFQMSPVSKPHCTAILRLLQCQGDGQHGGGKY